MQRDEIEHVVGLLNGQIMPDAVLVELKCFFKENYNQELLAYLINKEYGCGRLDIILWDDINVKSFYNTSNNSFGLDTDKINRIKEEFSFLCHKYGVCPDYWFADQYIAVPKSIKDDLISLVLVKAETNIVSSLEKHTEVKKSVISGTNIHVFYQTDNDIKINSKSGFNATLEKEIFEQVKLFDDLDVVNNINVVFTSIQTLDEQFGSNIYLYLL